MEDRWPAARGGSGHTRTGRMRMIDKNDSRERTPQRGGGDAGEYRLLYTYLRDRFSDRLVLTFGQIEDLLGFSLPVAARVEREWWGTTHTVADRSKQSEAWTLARRTASVNLRAQYVTFERETSVGT
jgi:hypothetical protein